MGPTKKILFYCETERDRSTAEALGEALPGYAPVYCGAAYGSGVFSLRPDQKARYAAPREHARDDQPWALRRLLRSFDLASRKQAARQLLHATSPDVIVLFEENAGSPTLAVANAASSCRIPYLIVPQTIPNPHEQARFYQSSREHDGERLAGRVVTWLAPRWGHSHAGHRLIRMPIRHILAQHLLGLAPRHPWILNSGAARAICIECTAFYARYKQLGFADAQLRLIGHPVDDALDAGLATRDATRASLEQSLGLGRERPLLVVAFPPDQYGAADISGYEWPHFRAMCEGWKQALDPLRDRAGIVIRPHPRLRREQLQVFTDAGYVVSDLPTQALVPVADLYIACVSATIRWALALGIPVINYDCYRYSYRDYEDALGARTIQDCDTFQHTLMDLTADAASRHALKQMARSDAHRWGMIDGRFMERFSGLIGEIVGTQYQ